MRKTREVSLADFSEEKISQGLKGLEDWLLKHRALGTADDSLILPDGITAEEIVNTLKTREAEKSLGQQDIFEYIFISYLQGRETKTKR